MGRAQTDLAPRKHWRLRPIRLESAGDATAPRGLLRGRTCTWDLPAGARETWIAFRLADSARGAGMFTYSAAPQVETVLEVSWNSPDGRRGRWVELDRAMSGPFLNKIDLLPQPRAWYRIRFRSAGEDLRKLWNLGLYAPRAGARNDYWIVLGASIQNQSMRHARFNPLITRAYPGYDPVLFNLAVRGWSAKDLLANLPALLEQHPFAGYALIHIGGNDVSYARPWDRGAWELERNLGAILDTVEKAGVVPILARLSYRRYGGDFPVPPEWNGSLPYVLGVHDPLCRERTPRFVGAGLGTCAADFYAWYRQHPDELAADGIHMNLRGERSWCRIWAETVGPRVYGRPVPKTGPEERRVVFRSVEAREGARLGPVWARPDRPWSLRVRDRAGRTVLARAFDGQGKALRPVWDLRIEGRPAAPGVYFYAFGQDGKRTEGALVLAD